MSAIWRVCDAGVCAPLAVHPERRSMLVQYLHHRLRILRAQTKGYVYPLDVVLNDTHLCLVFSDSAVIEDARQYRPSMSRSIRHWKERVFLPALEAVLWAHVRHIAGFAPFWPVNGRWIPPLTWFTGPKEQSPSSFTSDYHHLLVWVERELEHLSLKWGAKELHSMAEPILRALKDANVEVLGQLVESESGGAAREGRQRPCAPTFLSVLVEAEGMEKLGTLFRYQRVSKEDPHPMGNARVADWVVRVDTRWKDPHFPGLARPSLQEVWDNLIEGSRSLPLLSVSEQLPNPTVQKPTSEGLFRWVGVHEDQPILFLRRDTQILPLEGFIYVHAPGDLELLRRKRRFSSFAGEHQVFSVLREKNLKNIPFDGNTCQREALEERILATRGVFAVQGPPGTGKTYLATQVVRRFLGQKPDGRVLICAKEHFALDHILRKITEALKEDGLPFRAFRSVSLARQRRSQGKVDSIYTEAAIVRAFSELRFRPEASDWEQWQVSTMNLHDLRLGTLGKASANLFFATTMDASMTDLIGNQSFDIVIVEESGKCYPSELLHALCLGRTALMIGDQRQLPPFQERRTREGLEQWMNAIRVARSEQKRRLELEERFGETYRLLNAFFEDHGPLQAEEQAWLRPFELLFERMTTRYRLEQQFRMEAPLAEMIGEVFYGRPFQHQKNVASTLEGVIPPELDLPLLWIETPHMVEVPEATEDAAKCGARDNAYECALIIEYLRRLRPVQAVDLVILTPYNDQKRLLLDNQLLREHCARLSSSPIDQIVRTTDEYQGREAMLTILSLVRNNSQGARAWGFMTEPERLNVMFSRARYRQVVIGCAAHIERHTAEANWLHKIWVRYKALARDPLKARILSALKWRTNG